MLIIFELIVGGNALLISLNPGTPLGAKYNAKIDKSVYGVLNLAKPPLPCNSAGADITQTSVFLGKKRQETAIATPADLLDHLAEAS